MILVSDVDRTLLDPGSTEGPKCRELFKRAAAGGATCGLASSRALPSLREAVPHALAVSAFAVCSDGAISYRRTERNALAVVRRALLRNWSSILRSLCCDSCRNGIGNASIFAFLDDRHDLRVCASVDDAHRPIIGELMQGRELVALSSLPSDGDVLSVGVLTSEIGALTAHGLLQSVGPGVHLRVFEELRTPGSELWWCEASSLSADKAHAFDALGALGSNDWIGPVVLLADGVNDVPLAERADFVFCPPWSAPPLLELATEVVQSDDCEQFLGEVSFRLGPLLRRLV